MNRDEIKILVDGLDPVDWVQMELLANLTPAERVMAGMRAQAFAMSALRGTLRKKYPDLSMAEINMKTLSQLTFVRMEEPGT